MNDTCKICGRDIFFCTLSEDWWHVEPVQGHYAEPDMAKDNVKALDKFTSEELLAEVSRRKNQNKGWGFVYIDDSDAEPGDKPRFGIVEIAEWEKDGCLGDYCLGNRISLPKFFTESSESQYEYLGKGGKNEAVRLLKLSGFEYLGVMGI